MCFVPDARGSVQVEENISEHHGRVPPMSLTDPFIQAKPVVDVEARLRGECPGIAGGGDRDKGCRRSRRWRWGRVVIGSHGERLDDAATAELRDEDGERSTSTKYVT